MALHVEKTIPINAPIQKVWQVIDDFGGVYKYHPVVEKSPMLSENATGLGAKRRCEFYDNTSVVEEITEYKPGEYLKVEVSEFSMPLKSMTGIMRIKSVDNTTTAVTIELDFVVKGGILGELMGVLMMRPMMKGMMLKVLKSLEYHVISGKQVGNGLPDKKELSLALSK